MNTPAVASSGVPISLPDHLQRHIRTARQLAELHAERSVAMHPTGVAPLDRLLSGGLPRGQLVELIGRRSSGRFSIVLATLAAATTRGEAVALVDLGDALDPQRAAASGVDLERLLWARPTHVKPALIAAEAALGAGFPLVVLDLGLPPVPGGRGTETAWLRLTRAADTQQSALFVTAPYRVSGTAAAAVLRIAEARPGWDGHGRSPCLLQSTQTRLQLEKQRGRVCGATEPLQLLTEERVAHRSTEPLDPPPDSRELERSPWDSKKVHSS